jgi:hypothetical protein
MPLTAGTIVVTTFIGQLADMSGFATAAWISVWAPVPVIVIIAPATNTQGRAR